MLANSSLYKRTRKDHVLNNEPIKLKKEYCEMCFIKFSLTKMKIAHNCKRCFRTVCDTCGNQREKIVGCIDKSEEIHRICNICKEERVQIQQFCQKNMLKWGKSSRVSQRWLESLGLHSQKKELDEEYQALKGSISKGWEEFSSRTPELQQIKKDLQGFLTSAISYNYSFCEFLSILQSDVSNSQIQQEIYNILTRFLFKYPEIGYTSEYLRILTFLLCFCSQQDAFFIFSNLIYYTFPPPLFPKQAKLNKMESVEKYIKYLIDDFVLQKSFEEKDLLLLKQFLSGSYFQYYQSIFVNFLPVLVTFSVLDNIIMAKEFKVIEKYTKALCFMHLRNMRQVGSNTDQLNEVILRNTTRIQELDKIISQNFKNSITYSLDMLDKETFSTIQAQSQSVDLQSQITNLKSTIQSMNEYSKVLHEELQKKNAQIEELNQRANEEISKKNTKEEDELRALIESLKKRLNETEMANKNLKVEVFEQNIGSMKKNKRYEDEIAGLNQMLFNFQGNLKQETEKTRQAQFHLSQLKMKYNEEGTKMTNLLSQERQRSNMLQQQLMQERSIKSPNVEDKSYKTNSIGGSVPSSPQAHSINAFQTSNTYENKDNNINNQSPAANNSPSPVVNNKSNNSIAGSSAISVPSSPGQNEADIQRLQSQIQQLQTKLAQQNGYIETMRSKGQQLQIAYNKLFKDSQAQEAATKMKEQQNKTAAEEERKQAEEQLAKIHGLAIEEAIKIERQKGEQIISKMNETLSEQHKKWQIQMQGLNEKMLDANRRCEAAQKTAERLLEEGKAHELDANMLFQQQLSQKQVSIDQKLAIIKEKEEEELIMKSEIEKLKEQIVQYSHLERDIATMQIRISELEEELKAKNEENNQVQEQLKQKNEEFSMISDSIQEMKLWKEEKQKQEEIMAQKQKSLEEKQRNIDETVNKFEQDQHRLQEEEIALQERQEDIEMKESNIKQKEEDIKAQLNKLTKREEEIELKEENIRKQLEMHAKKEQDLTQNQTNLLNQNKELEAKQVRIEEKRTAMQKEKEELRMRESACAAKEQEIQQLGANLNSQQAEIEREKKKIEEEVQRKAAQLEQCLQEESQLQEQKRIHENNLNSIAGRLVQIESQLVKAHTKIQQDTQTIYLQLNPTESSEIQQQQNEISLINNSQDILNTQETQQTQQDTEENNAERNQENNNSYLLNNTGHLEEQNAENPIKINSEHTGNNSELFNQQND